MALLQPAAAVYHHPLDTTAESLKSDVWTAGVKPSGTVNLAAAKISNGMLPKAVYDAGLGTVPDSQGWALSESNGPAAASVSGGFLSSVTTVNSQTQYWHRINLAGTDFTTDDFEIEFDLKIITSTFFQGSDYWVIGWSCQFQDKNLTGFYWGLSSTGARLSNDVGAIKNVNSTGFINTATTDDFHKYRFTVSGGTGRLFKNGSLLGSIGTGPNNGTVAGRMYFGDPTGSARSDTRLRTVTFPSAKLSGTGASYDSVIGSTKLAYTGWLRNPSAQ